jgi:hypothetical protein
MNGPLPIGHREFQHEIASAWHDNESSPPEMHYDLANPIVMTTDRAVCGESETFSPRTSTLP